MAKLTDYFPEKEVLKALLNHAIIQEGLGGESPNPWLNSLLSLKVCVLMKYPIYFPGTFSPASLSITWRGKTWPCVWGYLRWGAPPGRFHAELNFLLPIPPVLKKSLTLATLGKEEFLMQDQPKVAGDRVTVIHLSIEGKTSKK